MNQRFLVEDISCSGCVMMSWRMDTGFVDVYMDMEIAFRPGGRTWSCRFSGSYGSVKNEKPVCFLFCVVLLINGSCRVNIFQQEI